MQVTDHASGKVASTEYDLANRPMQMTIQDSAGDVEYRTTLRYDDQSRLSRFSENVGDVQYNTTYTYDKDSRVTEVGFGADNRKVAYTYDDVGRISSRTVTNLDNTYTSSYTFVPGSSAYGSTATSGLVSKITQPGISFEYTYDNRGNILSEKRGTLTTTYEYDGIGQLTRVNDPHENATWIYEYDRGGNILSKSKYAYTTGTLGDAVEVIPYGYTDTNWKDKLTSYNNVGITYDAIGNPTNDGTWTYTWEQGRKLKQMSKSGTTVAFEYDHNGLRTKKVATVNGVTTTTEYKLHGKLVTDLIQGSNSLHFYYDSASAPAMIDFNGTVYAYVKNLQGDIVGIVDSTGTLVAEYKYDAWGRPLSVTGTLATTLGALNPFRYRGYVWDEEMQLYYIRARYYNPAITRWATPEPNVYQGQFDIGAGIRAYNSYCYCTNCPLPYKDVSGGYITLIGDEEAKAEFYRAIAMLLTSEEFKTIYKRLVTSKYEIVIEIVDEIDDYNPSYDFVGGEKKIEWNPRLHAIVPNGNGTIVMRAAAVLAHEMIHACQHLLYIDYVYGIRDEKTYAVFEVSNIENVIFMELDALRIETIIMKELGWPSRDEYRENEGYLYEKRPKNVNTKSLTRKR